jgi:hypothetical protein
MLDGLFFVAAHQEGLVGTVMAGYDGHRGWIYCDLKPPPLVEDPERFNRSGESQQPPLKRANISHRDHRVAEKYFFFSFERERKIPDAACMVPISMKHDFSHEVVLSDFPSQKSDKK